MPPLKLRTVLSVLFLGSALAVGFFAGRLTSRPLKTTSSPLEMATINGAELFDSQTATITGRVIKVTGEKLTIQDEQNQAADFPVISTVLISKPVNGRPVASQSGGLKNLELNEDALINLVFKNGEYTITAITYLPPAPVFQAPPTGVTLSPPGQIKK
ncbi:hypothetical protein A2631_00385 [Candidatus Daviesbacteria bacterium RIFCSPHIGHO2_01_FULL_44_29]|uniref:Uncharacterized protein n=1 Tax=Candidatus Daviesbacteria bacterium RIFCSPHIGHO2_02_FULL_43_12 TaxID=1797776 RepID=A0A1F5KJB5_9BACT|nr:MAG: hypothetical protein A2631_00385 [Candidatus Daviesbacteria bacterium RIFCSPHIGHO2_01_FULL_44_29]OGE40900.1 MAG: hypothetical protein A3D25_03185 [Candidatus Daviesbacteria bacterium RIFCSPHIGHO2_02_FULL_43_12]OGE70052.1 MAG: hypothetical protein A3B55_02535 [Candidatus Daviesbacteria bacterium RIFCSPLOWO2_01_FULL_43_15]